MGYFPLTWFSPPHPLCKPAKRQPADLPRCHFVAVFSQILNSADKRQLKVWVFLSYCVWILIETFSWKMVFLFAWRSILANGGKSFQFHVCDTIISVNHKMAAWENLLWNLMIFRPADFCSCAVTLELLPRAFQCHLFSGGIRLSIEIEMWNWVHNLTSTSQGGRTQPRVFTSHCKGGGFYRHLRPISTQCLKHRLNFEQESGSLVVLKAWKVKICSTPLHDQGFRTQVQEVNTWYSHLVL